MIGRAAGGNHDFTDRFDIFRRPTELIEFDRFPVFRNTAAQGITDSFRLFKNFFDHEMFKSAFFSRFGIPVDFKYFFGNRLPIQVGHPDAVFFDNSDFAIIHDIGPARVIQDCRDIRCNIIFSITEADNERIIFFAADNRVGLIGGHENQRIRAAEPFQHAADGTGKITVIHVGAEMSHNFRICFRFELIAFSQ